MSARLRILAAAGALALAASGLAACGGGEGGTTTVTAATAPQAAAAPVAEVKAAVEAASGLRLAQVPVPDDARRGGVAAVLTSGPDEVDGQRLVVALAERGGAVTLDEATRRALAGLAGVDVDATSAPMGFGARVVKGDGDPVAVVYLAQASSRSDLQAVDRSDQVKRALASFGFTD